MKSLSSAEKNIDVLRPEKLKEYLPNTEKNFKYGVNYSKSLLEEIP